MKDSVTAEQTAFEEWIDSFEHLVQSKKEAEGGLLLGSLHASVFLENTRTLNWLCIAEGIANISEEEKSTVLELLESQVTAAVNLKGGIFKLLKTSINQPCDEDDYVKLLETVLENINTIKEIEERILDYEAGG